MWYAYVSEIHTWCDMYRICVCTAQYAETKCMMSYASQMRKTHSETEKENTRADYLTNKNVYFISICIHLMIVGVYILAEICSIFLFHSKYSNRLSRAMSSIRSRDFWIRIILFRFYESTTDEITLVLNLFESSQWLYDFILWICFKFFVHFNQNYWNLIKKI